MTIIPLSSVNSSSPVQTNVIPPAGSRKSHSANQVNFSASGGESQEGGSSHWFLKLVLACAGGYVAYRFLKNPIKNLIRDIGKDNFVDLFKKAEKKEILSWSDVESHMKSIGKANKNSKNGFVFRLNDAQRTGFKVTTNEGVALGHKAGESHVVTKTVVCDKLDAKLIKKFNGKYLIPFS